MADCCDSARPSRVPLAYRRRESPSLERRLSSGSLRRRAGLSLLPAAETCRPPERRPAGGGARRSTSIAWRSPESLRQRGVAHHSQDSDPHPRYLRLGRRPSGTRPFAPRRRGGRYCSGPTQSASVRRSAPERRRALQGLVVTTRPTPERKADHPVFFSPRCRRGPLTPSQHLRRKAR